MINIAGIYLLIRYIDLLKCNYKNIILLISRLFAGLANFELDLKKVAYSTLSQLEFIIRILSISSIISVFLHLFIHAILFKLILEKRTQKNQN